MMDDASINDDREDERRPSTIARACLCVAIIVCGLALRRFGLGLGLPAFVVKYGGSALWGAMVFFLVAMAVSHLARRSIAPINRVSASMAVTSTQAGLERSP